MKLKLFLVLLLSVFLVGCAGEFGLGRALDHSFHGP